ncbi:SDR family NAD(P)-dependent oxidoreductase [uncultured Tateyamaria sp.]|uniref:SDR family NAD(P)-dependent oxidoreductase n=1 Tax=uncultured Tateyamaria sp. TaxID=455651 RepID=UPI002611A381|nr:SDR family NAD(P)-dependent oxidoreductase [uncultured Tateyamaria sp.]
MTKTILITGATDGIGLLTARKLAAEGHQVLLHGRSEAKLEAAAAEVGGTPQTYRADLSKMGEVTAMADAIRADHNRLDVLINNAGILKTAQTQTEAGRDIRFDVNTIAPYVLTRRLLPILPPEARVVNLSSAAQAPVEVAAMTDFRAMGDMDAYAQSKLAITIWSAEMAKSLPDGPAIIAVNPGSLLASKMVKEGFGVAGSDLNVGADVLIDAALGDRFAQASGRYFDNDSGQFAAPHGAASDPAQVRAVMQALADLAGPLGA